MTTATPGTATADLLTGLAQMLHDAGLAVFRADGTPYAADETAVFFKDTPPDPDRVVVLSLYGANNDQPQITLGNQRVQVKMRGTAGDALDVDRLGDDLFFLLHGATNLMFGSVHVVQMLRISSLPLGMDVGERRWMRADNYSLDVDYPTSPNRPI